MKRSVMTLYSGAMDIDSHNVRIVLAEKGVDVDILHVDANNPPEDLLTLNPYNSVPTLVDRDLVLYKSQVIMEYLDERFPHPPLLPVYPVARAKSRLMLHRIQEDLLSQVSTIQEGSKEQSEKARKELRESLTTIAPLFAEMPYFLSDGFSMIDCSLGSLLWRLPSLGVELPKSAKPIVEYTKRIFNRDAFQISLSELERELREPL